MIYTVPGAVGSSPFSAALPSESPPAPPPESPPTPQREPLGQADSQRWQLRIPDGRVFGPVPKSELDQWVREGRITDKCHVLREGTQMWHPADTLFPELAAAHASGPFAQSGPGAGNPFADPAIDQPYAPSQVTRPVHGSLLTPHRGVLVLILAILGWAICFVFAPFAWAMGSADLRAMRGGTMDPSGMGMTQAGMILGMIQTILFIIAVVLLFVIAVAS